MKSLKNIGLFFLATCFFLACEENENVQEMDESLLANVTATVVSAADLPTAAITFINENFEGELVATAFSFETLVGDVQYEVELTNAVNLRFSQAGALLDFDDPELSCEGKRKKGMGKRRHKGMKDDSTHFERDTVSLAYSDLPVNAQTYLETNYPEGVILKIKSKTDSAGLVIYKVLLAEIGAIVFDADGEFLSIRERGGRNCLTFEVLALADLPEAVATYINENYPEAEFVRARLVTQDGVDTFQVYLADIGVLIFDDLGIFETLKTCGK